MDPFSGTPPLPKLPPPVDTLSPAAVELQKRAVANAYPEHVRDEPLDMTDSDHVDYGRPYSALNIGTVGIKEEALANTQAELDVQLASAIKRAVAHVREVAARRHIRAGTPEERVSLFLTSFRRELNLAGLKESHNWPSGLLHRYTWEDAGVPRKHSSTHWGRLMGIATSCKFIEAMKTDEDEAFENADIKLADMKDGLEVSRAFVARMKQLSESATSLFDQDLLNILAEFRPIIEGST